MKQYSITYFYDKRREKANGKYPLKLRVYYIPEQKAKFFPTNYDLTEREYDGLFNSKVIKSEFKELKFKLNAIELQVNNICEKIDPFSFEQLEKKLLQKKGDGQNVIYHYQNMILSYEKNEQFGTAQSYDLALRSLLKFQENLKRKSVNQLFFSEINASWLNEYEGFMTKGLGRSLTTVGIYLRTLRAIFNKAIREKEIDVDIYPFGRGKYQIPQVKKVKKALNKNAMSVLFNAMPKNEEQKRAKDFWFFSYICNGMNIKDIAFLTYGNLTSSDTIEFYRAKTIRTSKADLQPVIVYQNDYTNEVIHKYGKSDTVNKDEYIFNIISRSDTEFEKFRKVKNFTRFVNQNMKKLAVDNGITGDISTYWARHTFATTIVRNGASLEQASEALSHHDLKTTQGYFAGFEDEQKKEMANKLMNFD